MKVALVCIAKNEDNYIEEWVSYNLKLGFDQIFIYENDWVCKLDNEKLTKIQISGIDKQREAYSDFIKDYSNHYTHAAFFDVDEYLVLKKHKTVKELLSEYKYCHSLAINWVWFGDNGQKEIVDNNYSYIKRFTKRQKGVNEHVKCIVDLSKVKRMDVHNPYNLSSIDTNKKEFKGPFNPNGDDLIAQINHYYSRTPQEFKEKCDRGRADAKIKNHYSYRELANFNDIEDLTALNFMYNEL